MVTARIHATTVHPMNRFREKISGSDPITGFPVRFRYRAIQNGMRYGSQNVKRYTGASRKTRC